MSHVNSNNSKTGALQQPTRGHEGVDSSAGHGARVLMIDNYDSFTYNLVQALLVLGASVEVFRNDAITPTAAGQWGRAEGRGFTHVVISPGPGCPAEAGVSMDMIRHFAGKLPVLGVCLGHQAMAEVFGGVVRRAPRLMHGKPSVVLNDGAGVYLGLPERVVCGRYHSLAVAAADMPEGFVISSQTELGEIMGIRHETLELEGVQFHPESVLTPEGPKMLANFLRRSRGERRALATPVSASSTVGGTAQ